VYTDRMAPLLPSRRSRQELELDEDWCCTVCFGVLLEPVALACGHTLDMRCLRKVARSRQRACPTCRQALPAQLPCVNIQLRDLVERHHPELVR